MNEGVGRMPSFAELLDGLFRRRRKADGRRHTNDEVAVAIKATGVDISQSYISMLRNGDRVDPRGSHIKALAQYFNVPAGYFLDQETYRSIEDESVSVQVPDQRVRLRGLGPISQESRQLLESMAQRLSQLETPPGDR